MSPKKDEAFVRQSREEMQGRVRNTLQNISALCRLYDEGRHHIAFPLASEIHKFLTTGSGINVIRGDKLFPSVEFTYSERNILPEHKLIAGRVYADHVEFWPVLEGAQGVKLLKFREWWNRDVVYRAGGSANPTAIYVRFLTPRHKRKTLTRRAFIELMRNKCGAHLDNELPETLDALQRATSLGIIMTVNLGDRVLGTHDGTLPMTIGPAVAMVRQLGFEVLTAFRQQDNSVGAG